MVFLVLLAYANTWKGPFVFDDGPSIVHNASIRHLWPLGTVLQPELADGGLTVSGRPLVNLSFAINYAIGGLGVAGYHGVNIGIHALAGLCLFGLVRRTLLRPALADRFGRHAVTIAGGVAAIWMLHPLQTAAVTYIVQRAESLMGLCYLFALYAFLRGVDSPRRALWLGLSLCACFAGMGCKEVMVSAPLMIFLFDRTFVAGSVRQAWRLRWGYYVGLGCSWFLLAGLVAGTDGRGETAGLGSEVTPWNYALTQIEAVVHYLKLTFWPHPLVFDYGIATIDRLGAVGGRALLLAGLVAATLIALVRRPGLGFVAAWFFVLLAPSSSVVPVATQTMAEHRMYLALASPAVLLVLGLHRLLGGRAWLLAGGLAIGLGGMTFARNADYATVHGLWADTVAKRPTNARAQQNLGLAEQARENWASAETHLRAAVALAPHAPDLVYSLAALQSRLGRPTEAIMGYREAIRLDPSYGAAHNNLANLLYAAGRVEEAGQHYAAAVRVQPNFAGARNSYGLWLIDQGRPAEALDHLQTAIRLEPETAELHFNAGNACAVLGRFEAAAESYRATSRLDPTHAEAHNNLGNVLLELGRLPEAMAEFETAIRLRPEYLEPRRTLALLLLMHLNRPAEARPHLEILAQARPDDAEIASALAHARSVVR